MPTIKAQFRGLQEELPASNSPSGTCLDTLNTVIDGNSTLSGRLGFDVYDNNVGSHGNILNMFIATFSDGSVYIITKRIVSGTSGTPDKGQLWQRKLYPTTATWTVIQDLWPAGHSTTERGWFYMWADRVYYVDSKGGTKWHPSRTTISWKAGIENSLSPLLTTANGGGKEGYYHVAVTHKNTKTGEESVTSGMQTGGEAETRLSSENGGMAISNWQGLGAGVSDLIWDLAFEFDAHNVYCTLGNTERIGLGDGVAQYSYQLYLEEVVRTAKIWPMAIFNGLFRMDQIMASRPMLSNKGGQPPGAKYGCWNGSQAIYLEVYPKAKWSALGTFLTAGVKAPGVMMYSVPGFPAMVPQEHIETIPGGDGIDKKNVVPSGGSHEIASGIQGLVTGCGYVGGSFVAFTNSSTYLMTPNSSGNMKPQLADSTHGAIGYCPVVSTGSAVHAVGKDGWLRIGEGIQNIAYQQFTPTMQAIPDGGISATVGGYYSHRNEVWFAVAKAGGTKAQRILIWDEQKQELVAKFDPANLSTAGIKAMVELSHPTQSPIMLIALDTGVILSWPGSAYTDGSTAYACNWRGLFGQEKRADMLTFEQILSSMESVPAAGITLTVAGVQTAATAATATGVSKTIPKASVEPKETRLDTGVAMTFDASAHGRMFAVEYSSTTDQGADWKVGDTIIKINETKER